MDKDAQLQAILAAGRHIHAAVDTIDALVSVRLGVHRNDLRCLRLLEKGPATPGEVACYTGLTSGSVTALLDRLETGGLVERRRSVSDRRSVEIAIPESRTAEIRAHHGEIEQAIRDHFGTRPADEIAGTARALDQFADFLDVFALRFAVGCPDKT